MDRTLKFRAWDGEKMVVPDYIDRLGRAFWYENSVTERSYEVMQYCGRRDKNDNDVCECDIIQIEWDDGEITVDEIIWCDWGFCTNNFADLPDCMQIEVIGNSYENPELLK